MKFDIKKGPVNSKKADVLTIALNHRNQVINPELFDKDTLAHVKKFLALGDLANEVGKASNILGNELFARIVLVNIGDIELATNKQIFKAIKSVANLIKQLNIKNHSISFDQFVSTSKNYHQIAEYFSRAFIDATYLINSQKTTKKEPIKVFVNTIFYNGKDTNDLRLGLKHGTAIANGANLTKDLGNLPPNICTPTYLSTIAKKVASSYGMKAKIYDQKQIEKLKMGSFLSVAQGSREAPKFIVVESLKGPKNKKPIVLIGKGITFDAGGISIKPSPDMDEMKYDMCGAATVLGTMKTIGELSLPLNIIFLIPSCENLPDGKAVKPGDIVKSMSGQTIEILNTDAEGRLILCDALTYAERYKPEAVIDIATLTGACVIALGHHATGLFSNDESLTEELKSAGIKSLDEAWPMPLWEEYQSQLNSNFADMANIGGRAAGSITAACFLSRFAKQYKWAHLDIAGTAWVSGKEKGGTGRPVPLLSQYLIDKIKK